jgi:nucleoside-diphosphate-sugar epimerase
MIEPEKFVILGSSGILGMGFSAKLGVENVLKTPRVEVESWLSKNDFSSMRRYLTKLEPNTTVINAIGLTDPKTPIDELNRVNFVFPRELLNVVNDLGLKLITFGTILEKHSGLTGGNSYVKTKIDFLNHIQESSPAKSHLHIQLHTIYGAKRSHNHMLVEQIFRAISQKSYFEMSSGLQVREYHHIDDEINALLKVMRSGVFGIVELNAGNAIQIKQLATEIFTEFGQLPLLRFNPELDSEDVFNYFYEKSPYLADVSFRDPITGVIDYFNKRYQINP